MTTIREMRPDEAEAVTDLYLQACLVLSERDAEWGVPERDPIRRWIARTMETNDAACLVADVDGSITGYLLASVGRHPAMPGVMGEVEEVHVRSGRGERGLKRLLVDAGIAWARERGAGVIRSTIALDTPWTEKERSFWTSLGFLNEQSLVALYPGE